jgi:hypothetical protein
MRMIRKKNGIRMGDDAGMIRKMQKKDEDKEKGDEDDTKKMG